MEEGNNGLSLRENQLLALIQQGQTNREITGTMGVTTGRIDQLVRRLRKKTGACSKAALRNTVQPMTHDEGKSRC